ncbi:acyl-[acyl-carrier-protein] thioesterase [Flavobacterium sp. NST-5]|uniref:Acyl-[acyl-carrier-protein] thioesterase n=1 Tax=Flavobacterium ichthyis TaxID=2698827 RepID=A0ABW9Z7V9_9FLAO|nr:acyl-ACP thioesterase domain-containing protein [Flavobacterium ichthyis]NBL64271.1 acyl-[acyl-carrier-protein] thioesterase [Flavobacterium ichthyis]
MPIAPNFSSIHEVNFEINFTQCLPNGFLKITELCNILQLTAADHAEVGGLSFTDMQEFNQAWVMSRMRLEIHLLPKWRDKIRVKTWIVSLENSRSVRALEVWLGEEKLVGCETYWAVFNTKLRRPEALVLPHEHFEKFPEKFSTNERVKKIDLPNDSKVLSERKVVFSDLDIVNHVNNVKYLEWVLDVLDPKIILKQQIKNIDMNFMKELMLKDEFWVKGFIEDHKMIFSVEKEEKTCFGLELQF